MVTSNLIVVTNIYKCICIGNYLIVIIHCITTYDNVKINIEEDNIIRCREKVKVHIYPFGFYVYDINFWIR